MKLYLARQFLQLVGVVFGVVTITFILLRLTGNPIDTLLPPNATEAQRHLLIHELGLDRSYVSQYGTFLANVVHGNFGDSIISRVPAMTLVLRQLPSSLVLVVLSIAVATIIGVAGGIVAAMYRDRWPDRVVTVIAVAGQAVPVYWLGPLLIILFAVKLGMFPASGNARASSLVLPVVSLALAVLPYVLRVTRSTMIDVLASDYIRFHRAKGLSTASIMFVHALKNCLAPVLTLVALQAGVVMAGLVAIEQIYGRSGIGSLLVQSILARDYPVVQAAVLVIAVFVVLANTLSDIAVATLDPRLRIAAPGGAR